MNKAGLCAMITLLLENTSRKQSRNFWKPARSISCNTNMQQQQKQQQQQKAVTTTITDTPCNCMIDVFPNNQCNISYSFYQSQSSYHDRNHNKSKLFWLTSFLSYPTKQPPSSNSSSSTSEILLFESAKFLHFIWSSRLSIWAMAMASKNSFFFYGCIFNIRSCNFFRFLHFCL